jgi:hypothetical protein
VHHQPRARHLSQLENQTTEPPRDPGRFTFAFAVASEDADLALRIVAPLGQYTSIYVWAEPWSWCRVALGLPGADVHPLRAATLSHASRGAFQLGDNASALALADQALSLAKASCMNYLVGLRRLGGGLGVRS